MMVGADLMNTSSAFASFRNVRSGEHSSGLRKVMSISMIFTKGWVYSGKSLKYVYVPEWNAVPSHWNLWKWWACSWNAWNNLGNLGLFTLFYGHQLSNTNISQKSLFTCIYFLVIIVRHFKYILWICSSVSGLLCLFDIFCEHVYFYARSAEWTPVPQYISYKS